MLKIQIIVLVILIMLSSFFSGIETALMSLNSIKVKALVKQKRKGADTLEKIKSNTHRLLITILVGNNLVNIGAASLATVAFMNLFGSKGVGIATGVMTFLILIFGEITPKTFAANNAERISLIIAKPIKMLMILIHPVVWLLERLSRLMERLLRSEDGDKLSEEELKTIVTMGKDEGLLRKEAAEMMHNVLEFEDTNVTEIMTPKVKVEFVDGNKKLKQILSFVVKSNFSRFPVYEKEKDDVIGILDVDDVLKYVKNKNLDVLVKRIVRPVEFVPETKKIADLLIESEGRDVPMSIVVDEYGYVEGLVTVEDILEEIVGDIFDKSKKRHSYIKRVNSKLTRVDATAPIDELNKFLKLGIDEDKFNTIAGFIQHKLGRIPDKGEQINLKNVILVVDRVTKQGIKSVKVVRG